MARPPCLYVSWLLSHPRLEGLVPCMVQGPGQYSIFTVSGPPVDTSIWTQGMPFQSRYRSSIVSDNSGLWPYTTSYGDDVYNLWQTSWFIQTGRVPVTRALSLVLSTGHGVMIMRKNRLWRSQTNLWPECHFSRTALYNYSPLDPSCPMWLADTIRTRPIPQLYKLKESCHYTPELSSPGSAKEEANESSAT